MEIQPVIPIPFYIRHSEDFEAFLLSCCCFDCFSLCDCWLDGYGPVVDPLVRPVCFRLRRWRRQWRRQRLLHWNCATAVEIVCSSLVWSATTADDVVIPVHRSSPALENASSVGIAERGSWPENAVFSDSLSRHHFRHFAFSNVVQLDTVTWCTPPPHCWLAARTLGLADHKTFRANFFVKEFESGQENRLWPRFELLAVSFMSRTKLWQSESQHNTIWRRWFLSFTFSI